MSKEQDFSDKLSSGNPLNCDGFSQIYPDAWKAAEERKRRLWEARQKENLNRLEASDFLNISLSTLDKLVKNGEVPYVRIGWRVLFKRISLQVWLNSKEVHPEPQENK